MPSSFARLQFAPPRRVYRRLSAAIDAFTLRPGDPLKLAFPAKVGFELHEDAQHVEEAPASRGAGVDRLFGCLQRCIARLDGPVLRRVAGARRGSAAYPPIAAVRG